MFGLKKRSLALPPSPSPLEIHLVRHGEAYDESGVDTHGPELTPMGLQQARQLAKRLSNNHYSAIYCSDLTRARQTADAITHHHADALLTVTRDLREVSGDHSTLIRSRLTVHSDRSMIEEQDAMHRVINHIREIHSQPECILIVSHGNIMRSLIPMLGGLEPSNAPLLEIYNTALCIVDCWPTNRAVLRLANCVSHLNERLIS